MRPELLASCQRSSVSESTYMLQKGNAVQLGEVCLGHCKRVRRMHRQIANQQAVLWGQPFSHIHTYG